MAETTFYIKFSIKIFITEFFYNVILHSDRWIYIQVYDQLNWYVDELSVQLFHCSWMLINILITKIIILSLKYYRKWIQWRQKPINIGVTCLKCNSSFGFYRLGQLAPDSGSDPWLISYEFDLNLMQNRITNDVWFL